MFQDIHLPSKQQSLKVRITTLDAASFYLFFLKDIFNMSKYFLQPCNQNSFPMKKKEADLTQ